MTSPRQRLGAPRLDWAVFDGKSIVLQSQSPNTEIGIKATVKAIKSLPGFAITESVCCMEHTGIYNAHALSCLHKLHFPLWLENSLQIKKSSGMQRGKNDAIDAARIAQYACRFHDRIRLWQPPRPVIQKLAYLSALRQRLLVARRQLQQPVAELEGFVDKAVVQQMLKACRASLKSLDTDLVTTDSQIKELIQKDDQLRELFGLITSVPGGGATTAAELLVATGEFKSITDPRKLAASAVRLPRRGCPL